MTTQLKKYLDRLMGQNLKRMREERGWSQEKLAEMIDTDRRYISAVENGRGIGKSLLDRLCRVFDVTEDAFTPQQVMGEQSEAYGKLSEVIRMLLKELQGLPEYEQLRWLADIKEKKAQNQKVV
jgi:transcriptional regulator with XRE-family HTH domain